MGKASSPFREFVVTCKQQLEGSGELSCEMSCSPEAFRLQNFLALFPKKGYLLAIYKVQIEKRSFPWRGLNQRGQLSGYFPHPRLTGYERLNQRGVQNGHSFKYRKYLSFQSGG
jgi:hypothetical protein